MSVSWRPGGGAIDWAYGYGNGGSVMSETDVDVPGRSVQSEGLVARALALVDAGTTKRPDVLGFPSSTTEAPTCSVANARWS